MGDAAPPSVVSAGYAPLDITSYEARVWHAAGGTAGNVAAILGFLGWRSTLVTSLGDDVAGATIRRDLRAAGVTVRPLQPTPGLRTPRIVHEINDGSHAYRYRCSTCNQRLPSSRPLTAAVAGEAIAELDPPHVFFFDRLNAGTIMLAEHFVERGSSIVFEPSRPARPDLTDRALAIAHVVKLADERSTALADSGGRAGQIWIRTEGEQGARYRLGTGAWHRSPAFSYPVVDAGGAGDWTTAGFLHALGSDRRTVARVGDALRWAQALAAVSCGFAGARGLARHGTPDSVLAAATSLEERRAAREAKSAAGPNVSEPIPADACPSCLLANDCASQANSLG